MNFSLFPVIVYIIVPLVTALITYILRSFGQRLDAIEEKLNHRITETEVRQIIADKVDPLKESLKEIKDKIDKLFDLILAKEVK
jgi:hypothetical protein